MRCLVIPVEGFPETREVEGNADEIRSIIGGWLEAVNLLDFPAHLYVDEEGMLKGKPLNRLASTLTGRALVGDAVVFGSHAIPDEGDVPERLVLVLGV